MTETHYRVIADRDRGDDPHNWDRVEDGDRVIVKHEGGEFWPVRIERPVLTTAAAELLAAGEFQDPPTRDRVYHAAAWAVRDAGGAATELQVTEALDRVYGGKRMAVRTREQIAEVDIAAVEEMGGCVLPTEIGMRAAFEWLAQQEGVRPDWYAEEVPAILAGIDAARRLLALIQNGADA